jgi:hypothetical protein
MSIAGLIATFIILTAVLAWVLRPFYAADPLAADSRNPLDRQRERLDVYYARVLRNLHDLDEDFATGKLEEAEYNADRELWVQRGVIALKAIDELAENAIVDTAHADDAAIDAAIDDRIEAAVRSLRHSPPGAAT